MSETMMERSPLNGEVRPFKFKDSPFVPAFDHTQDEMGWFFFSEDLYMKWHSGITAEDQKVLALVRSILCRRHIRTKTKLVGVPAFILDDDKGGLVGAMGTGPYADTWYARTRDDLLSETESLSFVDRAQETLISFAGMHPDGEGFLPPHTFQDETSHLRARVGVTSPTDNGLCYACVPPMAAAVMGYLLEEGYLRETKVGYGLGAAISPSGWRLIDEASRGRSPRKRQVFFVRSFDHRHDALLERARKAVEGDLRCSFGPVWAKESNEKLDERIFREIREASVVVVDVTVNYNVGMEHGYALALGKPIVTIREKPDPWVPAYFDIRTQNVYDYTTDEKGESELIAKLIARIGLEFELQM
ncbi:hypothetical protein EON81_17700 [bacterium]|nr:MAG: hypothetical protein EON81_17700 [bacterium]